MSLSELPGARPHRPGNGRSNSSSSSNEGERSPTPNDVAPGHEIVPEEPVLAMLSAITLGEGSHRPPPIQNKNFHHTPVLTRSSFRVRQDILSVGDAHDHKHRG